MTKHEKILVVLLLGSVWGALELFGRDLLRSAGVADKSAVLFGLGIIILYASKRLIDFPGSVIIMALIAGLFKTASSEFYACQFTAVVINGIVFDLAYSFFRTRLNAGLLFRALAAPVITYTSYAAFALLATYVLRVGTWASAGGEEVRAYLGMDALIASLISIVTIHLGYYLGNALQPYALPGKLRTPVAAFRIASVVLVAAIWIAGQLYRTT